MRVVSVPIWTPSVDLVQQQPGQLGVVGVEPAGERLGQGGALGLHLAAGQAGEHLRVALAGDQRLQHVPGRGGVQRARHRRHLDQGVLQQLLQPLPIPGALVGQVDPQPGVIPQLADLGRGHEAGPQHAPLGQLRQPHAVELVSLGAARHVLDLVGVDQLHPQARRFQQIEKRPPVVRSGLDRHPLDPKARQMLAQLNDRIGGRVDLPDLGHPPTHLRLVRHPGAHHARRLGHIHSGHPLQDLVVVFVLDLLRLPHRRTVSSLRMASYQGCPGASVGSRKSDRRAPSTVRDP
jgi:hypothetical protein